MQTIFKRNELRNNKLSFLILFFLVFLRLTDHYLANLICDSDSPTCFPYLYLSTTYVLVNVLVWLNKNNLGSLNIDRTFITIIVLSGFLLFLVYLPLELGLLAVIVAAYTFWMLKNHQLTFGNNAKINAKIVALILLALLPLIPTYFYMFSSSVNLPFDRQSLLFAAFDANLPAIVFEEMLFRGVFWLFLGVLGLNDRKIVFAQAMLFWVAHYQLLLSGSSYSFWIAIPFVSLLYGLIVWRSRSITPSAVSHFLYNFLVDLVKTSV